MRTSTLLATVLTMLLLPVPVAGAAAIAPTTSPAAAAEAFPCPIPPRQGRTLAFPGSATCARCGTAGAAGVSGGDRDAYRCASVPRVVLDGDSHLLLPDRTRGTAAPDPYVDALAPDNEVRVDDAAGLVGAPDGRYAVVHGRFGKFLVLDLGAGEEGVGDLQVHYALEPNDLFGMYMDVHFLDRQGKRLGQGRLGMIGSAGVVTVKNPSSAPYRYLKILTGLHTVAFDSMVASGLAP